MRILESKNKAISNTGITEDGGPAYFPYKLRSLAFHENTLAGQHVLKTYVIHGNVC
jgi:hypothetical protein